MGTLTAFLNLYKPASGEIGYDDEMNGSMDVLDAALKLYLDIPNYTGVWTNSKSFGVSDIAFDPDLLTFWVCNQAHTSPASGDFATARAASPARWSLKSPAPIMSDAASDGKTYGRKDGTWVETLGSSGGTINNGINFGSVLASSPTDLSKHIALWSTTFGFSITSNRLNYVVSSSSIHAFGVAGVDKLIVNGAGITVSDGDLYMGSNEFALVYDGTNRYLRFSNSDLGVMQYTIADGTMRWILGGATQWRSDPNGDFTVRAAAFKPGGGSWSATSDERVKTVVGPYTSSLAELVKLQPVLYEYNTQSGFPARDRPHVGLVAQQVEHTMPELVSVSRGLLGGKFVDDLRYLDPSPLVFALINAVRELNDRVAILEQSCRN